MSLFQELMKNAIYTQNSVTSINGVSTIVSSPQNVGEIQSYGVEISGMANDVGIRGLDLNGTMTWTASEITQNTLADAASAAAGATATNPNANQPSTGKQQPRVPVWRASGNVVYTSRGHRCGFYKPYKSRFARVICIFIFRICDPVEYII